jgi:hypothetical protein
MGTLEKFFNLVTYWQALYLILFFWPAPDSAHEHAPHPAR